MFDNRLLNLDILPLVAANSDEANQSKPNTKFNNNNEQAATKMQQENSRMSIESLNSNGNTNKRRQLPQIPQAKPKPKGLKLKLKIFFLNKIYKKIFFCFS